MKGQLPIHCAASHGLTSAIECLLSCGTDAGLPQDELHRMLEEVSVHVVHWGITDNLVSKKKQCLYLLREQS